MSESISPEHCWHNPPVWSIRLCQIPLVWLCLWDYGSMATLLWPLQPQQLGWGQLWLHVVTLFYKYTRTPTYQYFNVWSKPADLWPQEQYNLYIIPSLHNNTRAIAIPLSMSDHNNAATFASTTTRSKSTWLVNTPHHLLWYMVYYHYN